MNAIKAAITKIIRAIIGIFFGVIALSIFIAVGCSDTGSKKSPPATEVDLPKPTGGYVAEEKPMPKVVSTKTRQSAPKAIPSKLPQYIYADFDGPGFEHSKGRFWFKSLQRLQNGHVAVHVDTLWASGSQTFTEMEVDCKRRKFKVTRFHDVTDNMDDVLTGRWDGTVSGSSKDLTIQYVCDVQKSV